MSRRIFLVIVGLVTAVWAAAATTRTPLRRLLVVTHSAGYEHDVIRRVAPDRPAQVEQVLTDLGRESGAFAVTFRHSSEDLGALTADVLRQFHAVLFFTTGSLPLSPDSRRALFQHVWDGAGFIGVHSASDTWYDVPAYGELLGGVFDGHPWHERVRIVVEDSSHPATTHLGTAFWITDEIYQFRHWSRQGVHVLLRLDADSIDARRGKRSDQDYALSWTRRHGQGRVFYTALGHEPDVWADDRFRRHLLGGIRWTLGSP